MNKNIMFLYNRQWCRIVLILFHMLFTIQKVTNKARHTVIQFLKYTNNTNTQ